MRSLFSRLWQRLHNWWWPQTVAPAVPTSATVLRSGFKSQSETCPYCKNEDTTRIHAGACERLYGPEFSDYEAYYAGRKFKAFECSFCHASFHFEVN